MLNKNKIKILKRKVISLERKIQILDRLKKGESSSALAKILNLNESTVRSIKKNEEKIRMSVSVGSSISLNRVSHARPLIMEAMEKSLMIWIEDSTNKQIHLDSNVIKQKALKIYKHLKEINQSPFQDQQSNRAFSASKGWFENFKRRFSLHKNKVKVDRVLGDTNTTEKFNEEEASTLNVYWKHMWPEVILKENVMSPVKNEYDDIGSHELIEEKYLKEEPIEFSDEQSSNLAKDYDTESNCSESETNFTLKSIEEGLELANKLKCFFIDIDPSAERSEKFSRELQKCLAPYQEIYTNLQKSRQLHGSEFPNNDLIRNDNEDIHSDIHNDVQPLHKKKCRRNQRNRTKKKIV